MKKQELNVKNFELKSYTKKELRAMFGVPERTFNLWLKPYREEIGLGNGKYLTVNQVRFIIEKLGIPGEVEIE